MKSKGSTAAIVAGICLVSIIWLFKAIMLLGIIGSVIAIVYFGIKAIQNKDGRKDLLLKRVLPGFVVLLVCGGIYGAMSDSSASSTKSAESSKVESSSKSEKDDDSESNEDTEDDVDDDSSSDEYDSSEDNEYSDTSSEDQTSNVTTNDSGDTGTTSNGDMMTDQQGTIVGNSRTMVYHTPDQHGYRMNSANAVYFNTEAEAQAAGYRKSER